MRPIYLFLSMLFFSAQPFRAQRQRELYITWEEFVERYAPLLESDELQRKEEALEELEEIYLQPLNVNRITREELLRFPFLSEAAVDSLLAYRDRKHGFVSLGELQYVHRLEYDDRRYLSLFLYAGEREGEKKALAHRWFGGRHQLETSLQVPFYNRAGFKDYTDAELVENPNRKYLGNALHGTVRYRYSHTGGVDYGVSFDKDSGEPFAADGNYPFDHVSAFVRFKHRDFTYLLGNYRVAAGEGLLFGQAPFVGGNSTARLSQGGSRFRPAASLAESGYLQGAAVGWERSKAHLIVFSAYTPLDATMSGDTIRTLLSSGLHRTLRERSRDNNSAAFTAGAFAEWQEHAWGVGAGGYLCRYNHQVVPLERDYNRYRFRGRAAGGFSSYYHWRRGLWQLRGEVALDHKFHIAATQRVRLNVPDVVTAVLQLRHFPRSFVSRYGGTLQAGSEVRNESGARLALSTRGIPRTTLTTSVDFFNHPAATYLCGKSSQGMEAAVETLTDFGRRSPFRLAVRYRLRFREQRVTGYEGITEYRQVHRTRLQLQYVADHCTAHTSLDASLATRQTMRTPNFGWMLSQRATYDFSNRFILSAFAALFFTDSYDTALYAYEPQLRSTFAFPASAYHGARAALVAKWKILPSLELGVRTTWLKYFNRTTISSGTDAINGSSKTDAECMLKWKF